MVKTGSYSKTMSKHHVPKPSFFFHIGVSTLGISLSYFYFGRIRINSDGELSPGPQVFPSKWPVILTTSRCGQPYVSLKCFSPVPAPKSLTTLYYTTYLRFEGRELLGDGEVSTLGLLEPNVRLTALLSAPQKVGPTKNLLGGRSGDRVTGSVCVFFFFFGGGVS